MAFDGLKRELFDTYSEEKWTSNVHNLARMRGKDALVQLADALLANVGPHYDDLQRGHSDEIPSILNQKKVDSQWVYWTRNAEEKKALSVLFEKLKLDGSALMSTPTHDKHALVGLRVDHDDLRVGFRVASSAQIDCRNLGAKLAKGQYVEPFIALVHDLPHDFVVGFDESVVDAAHFGGDDAATLAPLLSDRAGHFEIRRSWTVDEAVEAGASILSPLAAALEALDPIFRFCAWSRENDHTDVGKQLREVEAKKQAKALAFEPGQQVRIIGGMFKGKTGRVEDIDAKAKVKVRVGTMSVMVSGRELTGM